MYENSERNTPQVLILEWIQNSEKQNSECYKTAKLQNSEECNKTATVTKI